MKFFVAFAVLIAVAVAAPQSNPDAAAQVLRYDNDNIGVDGYNWAVETSNGISQQESAQVVNAGSEAESLAVRGEYQYTGPDGVVYKVIYVADENGFQPQGAHLPVA